MVSAAEGPAIQHGAPRHNADPGKTGMMQKTESPSPRLRFSSSWDLLGPFQIGTREASWGADPLEHHGGFRTLQYDSKMAYPSSLGLAGQVRWTRRQATVIHDHSHAIEVALTVGFPDVEWDWLQHVYGWAALQYQAWARGELVVEGDDTQIVLLYTDNILEYRVNDKPYFGGDLYAYRRAPLVLSLQPGAHKIDIRLVRDVRAMGAMDATMSIRLKAERSEGGLVAEQENHLVSDVIDGKLASPYASLPVRNDGSSWIEIRTIEAISENCTASMLERTPNVRLAPGQRRPLGFRLHVSDASDPTISLRVTFAIDGVSPRLFTVDVSHALSFRDLHAPHKITFLHASQIVSYAILRAPSRRAISGAKPGQLLPVQLNLHGAGLESDSHQVRHMLDPVPDLRAWVLFPTGVTPWSGDDWHDWGFADVRASIASIPDWIERLAWQGPKADLDKWIVSGHSNGGQGTLYALTHHPDKIVGAAPVSGYLSIQKYVPYSMWNEADSRVTHVVQSSSQSFRHELLVENFRGIPVLQQHGSDDDNVPTFHSRRLNQLTSHAGQNKSREYVELTGKGHWYDGVMTTPPLKAFYTQCLAGEAKRPALPLKFRIMIANPADMGSRGGVLVDQLQIPDQLGKIDVTWDVDSASVHLETSNVRRFHFTSSSPFIKIPSQVVIDEQKLEMDNYMLGFLFEDGSWKISNDSQWMLHERHGSQLGPMQAILRTKGHFRVRCLLPECSDVASQISRNLYQYFAADSEIIEGASDTTLSPGNVITLAVGTAELPSPLSNFPISIRPETGIEISRRDGTKRRYAFQKGLGVLFLRPLANDRLELVIWGWDDGGLRRAARLLPLLTGVGQPDFVVVRERMAWEGAAGALAMGSFDSWWQIAEASFLQ